MPTYKLCSVAGPNSRAEQVIEEMTDEDFEKYEAGNMPVKDLDVYMGMAMEQQHFEFWIERVD